MKTIYASQNCEAQHAKWEGKCSDCEDCISYVEEIQLGEPKTREWSLEFDTGSSPQTKDLLWTKGLKIYV